MIFFRVIIILFFIFLANNSFADESGKKEKLLDQTNEIANQLQEDEEVPLNDPFAGNEGSNSISNIPEGEKEDEMSLYNFKLAGLISKIPGLITTKDPIKPIITALHLLKPTLSPNKIGEKAVTISGAINANVKALANGIIEIA